MCLFNSFRCCPTQLTLALHVQFFQERYESFADPDIPPFHYGSHYSSAGIVLFYLLRLEPFTGLARTLQVCLALPPSLLTDHVHLSLLTQLWLPAS